MNDKLSVSRLQRSLQLWFIAALVAMLTISSAPVQSAHAVATSKSDLAANILSIPKHVKACQTFEGTFSVTNLGPDPASHLNIMILLPDPFSLVGSLGAPDSLAVGETVTFSAVIKAVAFVPGEPRLTWIGVDAVSDPFPDTSTDPNPENNSVFRQIRLISKPVLSCP
ncbi:MAG TPA: hypothetical protein VK249_02735 [Anaerolineales bacterium]|nr:hypothetical protein [Anaerolineales bacterium]